MMSSYSAIFGNRPFPDEWSDRGPLSPQTIGPITHRLHQTRVQLQLLIGA